MTAADLIKPYGDNRMPYNSRWIEEKRVVYSQTIGQLTDEEVREMSDLHTQFLNTGTAPVHFLLDVKELKGAPVNLRQNLSMGAFLNHTALGWTVLIGGSAIVNFMVSIFGQVFHIKYARRDSYAEALDFLVQHDPTLPLRPDQP
jgi:hypothetical protein